MHKKDKQVCIFKQQPQKSHGQDIVLKCMSELAENMITKIYFQQEKPVLIGLKNYTNQ